MNNKKYRIFAFVITSLTAVIAAAFVLREINTKTVVIEHSADNSLSSSYTGENVDTFDTQRVVLAYKTENTDNLNEMEKKVLEKIRQVIPQIISDSMTEYEKELAVHDYIINTTSYDNGNLNALGIEEENSDNPYGTLIEGHSICSGYTSTFQMFMDIIGIPCKSVYAKDTFDEVHAWNMAELDNEWYYVDVTWDDPTPDEIDNRPVRHTYFNVTESLMKIKHIWDSTNLPEATSYKYAFASFNTHKLSSAAQMYDYMEQAFNNKNDSVYFTFSYDAGIDFSDSDTSDEYYELPDSAKEIREQLEKFENEHKDFYTCCRRTVYGDEIIFEINIKVR